MIFLFARMAWRNVFLHGKKSALAVLAVAACCFSLNIFQGYIRGAEVIFEDSYAKRSMFGNILVRKAGVHHVLSAEPEDLLSKDEQAVIEELFAERLEVAVFMRLLRLNGTLTNGQSQSVFTGFGYDVAKGEAMRKPVWTWNALAGQPLRRDDEESIHLGQGLALLLGCEPAQKKGFITGQGGFTAEDRPFTCATRRLQLSGVTLAGQANALDAEVTGLVDAMFRELDLRFVNLPLRMAQRLLDTDRISMFTVRLSEGADEAAFLASFRASAAARGLTLTAQSWKDDEIGDFYQRTMDFLHVFRNFMIVVILGVALLSIFNTFFRNVQERMREIGVLRTLGFRANDVRTLFLLETLFLALIGIAVGGGAAILASALINRISILYKIGLLTQPVPFLVEQNRWTLAWTLSVALVVALVAAAIPLWAAGRKRISEALTDT
jgi:ABC-type lipoprotein release transport system permease subunit